MLFVLHARGPSILRRLFSKQLNSVVVVILLSAWLYPQTLYGQILDKRAALNRETFWDNRDFDWYCDQIPFFECPDQDITTTYYYRWDLLTKHLTYGSPNSGYSFTEFIDRPFWSGAYGAISCPAGHQLYEARWLRSPRIANDYSRYWLRTPGAQPRNYSTWLADSMWAIHQVHPDRLFLLTHLNDLINNYRGWEERHFVPEVGLFWQTGHDDGMEFNINSRQTQDILRGAPSYRPSFNAYMWADAMAIARIADLAGQTDVAATYRAKGESIKTKMLALMWDEKRQFFFPVLKNDEEKNGHRLKALTRTYESGLFAGDPHGRELIGYVPWQFRMFATASQFDVAWKKLMDRDGFYATYGPSTVERHDPMFLLQKSCCWWSGQSWPYATTQTLKGLAHHLQFGGKVLTQDDYIESLAIYARSHRKDGKPYLAEALHPDTGSFEGHDGYNHSEHYFHSGYCDLVITGLAGLVPRDDATLEIRPLASKEWSYYALVDVPYRGHLISLVWDKVGDRYKLGPGFHVIVDNVVVKSLPDLESLEIENAVPFEPAKRPENHDAVLTNFAVNNDGTFYPRLTTSYTSEQTSQAKLHDGNYWYMRHPPNRWTCEDSPNSEDWIIVDFGTQRQLELVKLYVLDDSGEDDVKVRAPAKIELAFWKDGSWKPVPIVTTPVAIEGHRPVSLRFEPQLVEKLRITLKHSAGSRAGLTEIEAWGLAKLPLPPLPHPKENIAYNNGASEYPKATASYHDRFGGLPRSAIDGVTNFLPTPTNRWTSYESPNAQDWLEIDFGSEKEFSRVEMAIYDDRGGVQAPTDYVIQKWESGSWKTISETSRSPAKPIGGQWNTATFPSQKSSKLRVLFTNSSPARSGLSEIMVVDLAKDP